MHTITQDEDLARSLLRQATVVSEAFLNLPSVADDLLTHYKVEFDKIIEFLKNVTIEFPMGTDKKVIGLSWFIPNKVAL